jgi:hypothetical protein
MDNELAKIVAEVAELCEKHFFPAYTKAIEMGFTHENAYQYASDVTGLLANQYHRARVAQVERDMSNVGPVVH